MKLFKSLCKTAHSATDKQAVSKAPSPIIYIIGTIKSNNLYTRSGMRSHVRQFLVTTFPFGFLEFWGFRDAHSVPRGTEKLVKTIRTAKINSGSHTKCLLNL